MSGIISPTETIYTVQNHLPYNHKLLLTYLQSRLKQDQDIIIFHNEVEHSIKLSAVYNLILSFSKNPLDVEDLTINHLIVFIYYNQRQLLGVDGTLLNQFLLLHRGKRFQFQPPVKFLDKRQNPLVLLLLASNFNKFHLVINETTMSVYKYFSIENYLNIKKKDDSFVNRFKLYLKRQPEDELKIKRTNLSERRRGFRTLFRV